jgi:hypothetical protein
MESYLRSSSPPESKKKAAGVNNPSSLVDVSKSSHKSNKRSSIVTQIQVRASTFWAGGGVVAKPRIDASLVPLISCTELEQ